MLKLVTYNLDKGGPEDYSAWGRMLDVCDVLNSAPWIGRSDHFPVCASFAS